MMMMYIKICVQQLKKTKIVCQDQLSFNAGQKYCRMLQEEHSAILSTFVKLPFVIKSLVVLSIFEWTFYTGFTAIPTLKFGTPSELFLFYYLIINKDFYQAT